MCTLSRRDFFWDQQETRQMESAERWMSALRQHRRRQVVGSIEATA